MHASQAKLYGHPSGRALSPKLWADERSLVSDLFLKNATHKGQLQALAFIRGLMAQASANERAFKGAEELSRLARHGVTSAAILTEMCAAFIYLKANPRAVPDDKAFDFALSYAVFKLAPRPRRICRKPGSPWPVTRAAEQSSSYAPKARTSALAFVGKHLRMTLSGFLANVQHSVEMRDAQRAEFEAALTAPFSVV